MTKQMKYDVSQEIGNLAKTICADNPNVEIYKNNEKNEGFHRKMKLIQRMAYGYKNFQNYRLGGLVLYGIFR